jgi:hypothetical protein
MTIHWKHLTVNKTFFYKIYLATDGQMDGSTAEPTKSTPEAEVPTVETSESMVITKVTEAVETTVQVAETTVERMEVRVSKGNLNTKNQIQNHTLYLDVESVETVVLTKVEETVEASVQVTEAEKLEVRISKGNFKKSKIKYLDVDARIVLLEELGKTREKLVKAQDKIEEYDMCFRRIAKLGAEATDNEALTGKVVAELMSNGFDERLDNTYDLLLGTTLFLMHTFS